MARVELRNAQRYKLSLPVTVQAPAQEDPATGSGRTRDISTRGVYFLIQSDLKSGSKVDLMMKVPTEITGGADVFINVTGEVVRVEHLLENNDEKIGVAASIDHYEIVRSNAASS